MHQERQLHYGLIVRIYGDEKCFGPGIAQLLERVQVTHSLRQAAANMNMAYSKAWRIVKTAEEKGIVIVYGSIYGNTQNAAEILAAKLAQKEILKRFE